MPFVRGPNGGLLRGPSGGLASSVNCCCDNDCQPCCIKIAGGTLADGVISYFAFEGESTLEFTIVTESGTRQVCGEETITITLQGPGEITFDPAWQYVSATPAADDFQEYPGGYIIWEGGTENVAVLKLRNCFFYSIPSLGALTIRNGSVTEVVGISCVPTTPCCTQPWECEPCCYSLAKITVGGEDFVNYAPPTDWHWNANSPIGGRWEHLEFSNDVWFLFWLKPADAAHPALLCKDDLIKIGLNISSEDPLIVADLTRVYVSFLTDEFEEVVPSFDPATGTLVPDPDTITWTAEDALEFSADIKFNCDNPGQEIISFAAWIDIDGDTVQGVGDPAVSAVLLLEYCGDGTVDGCPNCGCPCCEGGLPDTLTVSWTYDGIDYSFDLHAITTECGQPNGWIYNDDEFNRDEIARTLQNFGAFCSEQPLSNIRVGHGCGNGWGIDLYFDGATINSFINPTPCTLPATLTLCGITYTISDGT